MPVDLTQITAYVAKHIGGFHQRRLKSLQSLDLDAVLKRKNPYLFRAKNLTTAGDLIKVLVEAHLSSQEETLFGIFLEGLAIYVCEMTFNGRKSAATGVDLEFGRDGVRYLVSIKSGPNWGNSSQIAKMKDHFKTAQKIIRTGGQRIQVCAVNGCCYGRDNTPDKGDYDKYCGQRFWSFISGSDSLYQDLIEPIGREARQRNQAFNEQLASRINQLTRDFIARYCNADGTIDWPHIVALNSGVSPSTAGQ